MKRKVVLEGLCVSLAVVCALGIVTAQRRVDNHENVNEVNEYHASEGDTEDTVLNYGGLENRQIEGDIKNITVIDSAGTVHTYSSDGTGGDKVSFNPTAQWEGKTDFEPR